MATAEFPRVTNERIDAYLDYLFREWNAIPALEAEWANWDDVSRLHFDIDWPVKEDRLATLDRWANQGYLSQSQKTRYKELLDLVERIRPIYDRMLAKWDEDIEAARALPESGDRA